MTNDKGKKARVCVSKSPHPPTHPIVIFFFFYFSNCFFYLYKFWSSLNWVKTARFNSHDQNVLDVTHVAQIACEWFQVIC